MFFAYWLAAPRRLLAMAVVLFASYLFYAKWGLVYLALIPLCSTVDYILGGMIHREQGVLRRLLLLTSVTLNIALILSSKIIAPDAPWALPLSLSFYGFQALTYTFDIYRKDAKPSDSYLAYLASVSFFPTILAGPITRVSTLIAQWNKQGAPLTNDDAGRALFLIGMGLLKKFLIADYLADNLVNRVFDTPNLYSSGESILGVYGYAFQLYYDFSGYTDVALGSALLLGFKLPANFKRPYAAAHIADFWRRWHISLSDWLRDYLYFSLPGLRAKTKIWTYLNLIVTMIIGGLWHGLTINFAVWGFIHGTALAVTRWFEARRGRTKVEIPRWRSLALQVLTFHIVCFAWIFFRAEDLPRATELIARIAALQFGFDNVTMPWLMVLAIAVLGHYVPANWYDRVQRAFQQAPALAQATTLVALAFAIQKVAGTGLAPFIYSKF